MLYLTFQLSKYLRIRGESLVGGQKGRLVRDNAEYQASLLIGQLSILVNALSYLQTSRGLHKGENRHQLLYIGLSFTKAELFITLIIYRIMEGPS